MPSTIRIQHLQWTGGAASALGCLLLGGTLVTSGLAELRRAERGMVELARFRTVVVAAGAISAERGPANSAMDPAETATTRLTALAAKRAEVDREIQRMRALFGGEIAGSKVLQDRLAALEARLGASRAVVDAVAALPPEQRHGAMIARAIEAMFAVADDAAALREALGQSLIRIAPQISTEIMLQASASAMREEAGRLGSYLVMRLTGGLEHEPARTAFAQTAGRITELWRLLQAYGRTFDGGETEQALQAVETLYFGRSWRLAHSVMAAEGPAPMSASAFTQAYVPNLDAPSRFRDGLGAVCQERMERLRAAALARMLFSGSLVGIILLVLALLVHVFRRSLFHPLLAVHAQVLAIARGDLSEPRRGSGIGREIAEMFEGLAILREQQRQRRALVRQQRVLTRQLRVLSETDALTGLLNRRALGPRARQVLEEADRLARPVGLILLDIDHFKAINDKHGHAAGDRVLAEIGVRLRSHMRADDAVARYGGEEFLVVLADCDMEGTRRLADGVRRAIAAHPVAHPQDGASLAVTASFGVAVREPGSGLGWEALVSLADRGLYAAKRAGRNRVCAAAPDPAAA